jgi:hypothetical protein
MFPHIDTHDGCFSLTQGGILICRGYDLQFAIVPNEPGSATAESYRILHDEHAEAGDQASLNLMTTDFYFKNYEKSRKSEKIGNLAFVKKACQMGHGFGMVNKFLTYTIFINIEWLSLSLI